jgi:F0F1-type ATP synthase assembly protein I
MYTMKKLPGPFRGYYLFLQISSIWLCSIFGGLAAGLWLDKKLGTAPWLLIILAILGFLFALYSVIRTVNQLK